MAKTQEELIKEICSLHKQAQTLCNAFQLQEASVNAANTHCTIIRWALVGACTQIANQSKNQNCSSTKVKACFLTLPELKAAHEEEEGKKAVPGSKSCKSSGKASGDRST